MRLSDRAKLIYTSNPVYDPNLGREVKKADEIVEVPCYVTPLSLERSVQLFGGYEKAKQQLIALNNFDKDPNKVSYKGKAFKVLLVKRSRRFVHLYLEGV